MIFATFSTPQAGPVPALVKNGRLYPLPFPDMLAVIKVGAEEAARHASEASFALDEVPLLPPLQPTSLRDAYAFEQHVRTASQNRGRDVPEGWYKFPVFYYTNPHSVNFSSTDAIVDGQDFNALVLNWQYGVASGSQSTYVPALVDGAPALVLVPEPAAGVLCLLAMGAALLTRRR